MKNNPIDTQKVWDALMASMPDGWTLMPARPRNDVPAGQMEIICPNGVSKGIITPPGWMSFNEHWNIYFTSEYPRPGGTLTIRDLPHGNETTGLPKLVCLLISYHDKHKSTTP